MNRISFFNVNSIFTIKKVSSPDVGLLRFGYVGDMNVRTSIAAEYQATRFDQAVPVLGEGFQNAWFNIDILLGFNFIAVTNFLKLPNAHRLDTFSSVLTVCCFGSDNGLL